MPDALPTREEIIESQRICEQEKDNSLFLRHCMSALPRLNAAYLELLSRLVEKDAEIERLRDASPGTPIGRLKSICDFAVEKCGHNPVSAKAPESTIYELVERLKAREAKWQQARVAALTAMLTRLRDWLRRAGIGHGYVEDIDKLLELQTEAVQVFS